MSAMVFCDDRWMGKHGIGRYATEVLQRLPNIQHLSLKGRPTSPLDPLTLTRSLKKSGAAVFYNPGFNAPLKWNGISLLTIHDLIHLDDPSQASLLKKSYYQVILKPTLLKAPFIFTVSKTSKHRLMEWLGVSEDRIVITPNGISADFQDTRQQKENYFVYVGTSRSHKNTVRMLRAFARIENKDLSLKWVGDISVEDQNLAQSLGLTDRIQNLRNLPDSTLAQIYAKAKGTIFISIIEGFGLPPLESIFCGTVPLIAINNPIESELGSLALTTNPYDLDSIVEKMNVLAKKEYYSEPDRLKIQSLRGVFNWEKTAATVAETLRIL